jgi:hypothetical protein
MMAITTSSSTSVKADRFWDMTKLLAQKWMNTSKLSPPRIAAASMTANVEILTNQRNAMYRPEEAGREGRVVRACQRAVAVGRRAKRTPQGKRLPRRVEDGLRVVQLVVAT